MISIINIGPAPTNRDALKQVKDKLGLHTYQLRINDHVITTFAHTRGDNLSTCLRKAAEAADKAHDAKLSDFMRRARK